MLNHFFVKVSTETFDAVYAAGDLGAIEKRTTVRKDRTYTGVYVYGENTYIELLHPDSDLGAPCGIAWQGRNANAELVYRGDKPWFWMSKTEPKFEGLIDWGMDYVPEYFGRSGKVSRSDALAHYAASCGKSRERAEGLFEDVADIEMSLSADDLRVAITAARLTLRRDAGKDERKLGDTTLSLDGRTAVWNFEER
jgi:Family of unknown function (DUF5829)